jgi:hypothetical protein
MSILVDYYNLELDTSDKVFARGPNDWKTPEEDRQKIIGFFKEHAPHVLKYQTEEELKEAILGNNSFDWLEAIGTLGMYEMLNDCEWFSSWRAHHFYIDYVMLRHVVDDYLDNQETDPGSWNWINATIRLAEPVIVFVDKRTGDVFSQADFPKNEKVDLEKYAALRSWLIGSEKDINIRELIGRLYNEIIELLEGKFPLKRCAADDCNRIFHPAPQGSEQKYCSARCRNRIAQRRIRE